jgi:hypothetical protein
MTDFTGDLVGGDASSPYDSPNCVNLIIDGPGDTTVRPVSPERRRQLMAERDKIARWQHMSKQPPDADKSDGPTRGDADGLQ